MHVVRVVTNETCNQNCAFCTARRPEEQPQLVRLAAERVQAAARGAPRQLVLTGGEPALRRDLAALVRLARAAEGAEVVLETNGALIDVDRAKELAAAGLDVARVHLPAWGERADAITRDPGGFERSLRALHELTAVGLAIEIAVPIVRANLTEVAEIPVRLAELPVSVRALVISVPSESPLDAQLASTSDAVRAVEALTASARRVGISVRFGQEAFLSPCVFPSPGRVAHLYALTQGGVERPGFSRIPACADCAVADRCPGIDSARLGREPELSDRARPIREDRLRRRLSLISSVSDQIARELVSRELCRQPDGTAVPMHTVRINFQCNQACHFCFVSTHLPAPEPEAVRAAIAEAGRAGAILALSGGEPTLNSLLCDYAVLAKQSGVSAIELQTNATRLAEPGMAQALIEAGVDVAFVSLHGSNSEISDAVTAAPGTFEKTVRGIDAAHAAGLGLRLNFVFCELNRADFPNVVRLIADRWPNAGLTISFVAPSTDLVPRDRALVPRYTDVIPHLAEGLRLVRELGVKSSGFESMCGLPLCLVPEGLDELLGLPEIPDDLDGGEFEKPEPCQRCEIRSRCYGIRRGYAELNGISELRPIPITA